MQSSQLISFFFLSFFLLFYIWKELEQRQFNGPGFKYKIYWRQASGSSPHWKESSASNPPFIVNGTGTFIPFEIKVQAVNELGVGPEPDAEIGYSGEDCAFLNIFLLQFYSVLCFILAQHFQKKYIFFSLFVKIFWQFHRNASQYLTVPLEAPSEVAVTELNKTTVLVRWSPVSMESVRGHLLGYKVHDL